MFTVLYNPTTKDIYLNQDGSVYEWFNDNKLYEKLSKEGYILKNVTENGVGYTLSYTETFCHCDRCGKLFLQNDLLFTDEGAPYCSKCYELYETYDTYFHCLGLPIISRGDYESMPAPMYAGEFNDDKMTELAEKIYLCLTNEYSYSKGDLETYFNNNSNDLIDYDLDMAFWCEMEKIAIEMGMRYYEDMTDEEYNEINKSKIIKKTFEQISREIEKTFFEKIYNGATDTEEILTKIIGKNVSMYDSKIDDGAGDDEDDNYVMCDCFSTDDGFITIRIYYGDETRVIGDVDVSTTAQ